MATNFSPCKGSYVLNQFPSNVMFGMNGFHVSASGAIQGHHGPLVFICTSIFAKYGSLCSKYVHNMRRSTTDTGHLWGGGGGGIQCYIRQPG